MASSALTVDHVLHQLLPLATAPHWWVAYSGGLDSTVLLHLLVNARRINPGLPALTALHVHHQLQAEADSWLAHCKQQCEGLGVNFDAQRVAVAVQGRGLEAAARDARQAVFANRLGQGEVLLTGHHQDDQVETFFLRLLRGAGVEGLGAMAASRPLGEGQLHRPLLEFPREQLLAYARLYNLSWIEDPSNRDTDLDRNYLRSRVLPMLAERWPGYRATVSRAALEQQAAAHALAEDLPPITTLHNRFGDPGLPLDDVLEQGDAQAARLLRRWLRQQGLRAPDRASLLEFLRQLGQAAADREPRLVVDGAVFQRFLGELYRLPATPDWRAAEGLELGAGNPLTHPGLGRLSLVPAGEGEPGIVLAPEERLTLRFRRGGERCRLASREGSHSLKKLLQEAAVPPWWRERLPLLYRGEELLAVADCWYCSGDVEEGHRASRKRWQVRWERNSATAAD
ncbi:tRNA lysidine(34) synthetase TilS [Parahaliea maris]|uniref:tRNA(Ile)-lysidine synthase n=1 Tax=Parahaliea maris TaxID=2716870 RepID=A0A5C9A3T8_9GAMM|nr:tRNA lysidine(34) synthetase TilS [Parahaliea maris]TXS95386.1 tRNA lysidine(34) synthetase TilS [Parahaliea maris]